MVGINCPVTEARWAESQSNHGAWAATLLSRKSCALTNGYNFWASDKRSIQQLVSKPRSRVQFSKGQLFSGTIAEGEIVASDINYPVAAAKWVDSQSNRGAWVVTFLSRKSCALTNGYSFWPSGKRSIQQIA